VSRANQSLVWILGRTALASALCVSCPSVEPERLARELGITGKRLRSWLRESFPRHPGQKGAPWELTDAQVSAARERFGSTRGSLSSSTTNPIRSGPSRSGSDEAYVIDLCDEILEERALRQHRFAWLQGDPGQDGRRASLPVDAYYPRRRLVVEYRERQHDEPVAFFDKPERVTVSGVHRGEQRRLYDRRREAEIPRNGLRLVIIRVSDFAATSSGRLRRERDVDLTAVRGLLGTERDESTTTP
jgi:hypothetical protein